MEGTKNGKHINLIDEIMNVVSKMAKARHARTAMVILSICVAGFLFMGSPFVNAQENEDISINDRLENIEEKLDNLHSSYITREIFDIRLSAMESTVNTELASVNRSLTMVWNVQMLVLAAVFTAFIAPTLADTYKKLKA